MITPNRNPRIMLQGNQESTGSTVFRAFSALEAGATYAGHAALIREHALAVPAPDILCAIGTRHRKGEHGRWRLYTPRHKPDDTLQGHLTFALKYEDIDLGLLKALFDGIDPQEIVNIVKAQPTGGYSRRIWFLYEWLTSTVLRYCRHKSRDS